MALVFGAGGLRAVEGQGCTTFVPPCPPNEPPQVVLSAGGSTFTSTPISITISLSDDASLDPSTLTKSSAITITGSSWGPNNATASLTGTATLSTGANTLIVNIADTQGLHGADTIVVTYTPPPPPPAQDSAVLSLAPYSSSVRQLAGCSGCLYGAASYATPAYVSRDQTRSVALLYSSAAAVPMGFVQVDATINTSTTPDRISIRLLQDTTPVALTNGGTEAFYTGTTGTVRLAAQFDASSLTTGFYDYTVQVRTWWSGTAHESRLLVRVLVLNRQTSTAGAGWTIAGLQRLWKTAGDSVAISDGSGGIVFFARTGSTTFARPAGDFSTLTVSGSGVYTRTTPDGAFARFNATGFLTATGTRFGDSITYAYDGSNRLSTITDEAGKATSFTYAPNGTCPPGATSGTLCAITTPGSRVSKLVVNNSNDLVQIVDPDGVTAFTGTYTSHRLTASTDRLSAVTRRTYDAFSALASLITPAVTTTTTGGSTSTDSATITMRSIEATLLATSNSTSGSARAVVLADTAYVALTASNGTVTKMVLQGAGEPTRQEVHPVAGPVRTISTFYNADFLPTTIIGTPVGGTATFTWNDDELLSTTDPAGTRTDIAYESTFHQPTTVRVNGVLQQTSYYDDTQLTLDSTVAGLAKREFHWDTHGRLTSTSDRQGHTMSTTYESSGFQNTQHSTIGSFVTQVVHDRFGRDSVVTDAQSHATTLLYDVLNRPTSVVQPGSATTTTAFTENTTAHTLTTTLTDPRSLTFSTVTNALGWPTATTDPQSHTATAGYDRNGLLRRAVNRLSHAVTFNYDSLGRIASRTANGVTTTFAYDTSTSPVAPHWMVADTPDSHDSVSTDATGRIVSERSVRGIGTFTLTTTYDRAGNRRALRVTNGTWSDSLVFGNDSVQFFPTSLPDFSGTWSVVRYTPDRLLDTLMSPTGTSGSSWLKVHPSAYTVFNRPGTVDARVGGSLREHWTYTYDQLGRVTKADTGQVHDFIERVFTYDVRGRLASYLDHHRFADSVRESCPDEQITCDPPPPWDFTWHDDTLRAVSYDPDFSGNRTDGGASLSNDRLASMTGADGRAYSFSYDTEGRVASKTATGYTQTYGWNDLGQLIWVKTNGDSVAFGYDAAGRRVRKWHSGTTTGYLWDGDQLLMELDGSGTPRFAYSYRAGLDQPVAVQTSAGVFYYELDELGNVAALWDSTNAKVATYAYDPYGYGLAAGGTLTQPLRWKGREYDSETGLYYVRARYYDPTVGRFVSEDPAGAAGGINPYTFADGEPANRIDPSGMDEVPAILPAVQIVENPVIPWWELWADLITVFHQRRGSSMLDGREWQEWVGGSVGGATAPLAQNACGPVLSQPSVQKAANRIWNQFKSDPAGREFAEELRRDATGRIYGVRIEQYITQTATDATFNLSALTWGSIHTHPKPGRSGLGGDLQLSLESSDEPNKIIVTVDSLYLIPRTPRMSNMGVSAACGRREHP